MTAPDVSALSTADFSLERLAATPDDLALVESFRAAENAKGLERYLKDCALRDEETNESRTYLVKDSVSGELACYFSLRACLVPVSLGNDLFATVPAVELANFAVNETYRSRQRAVRRRGGCASTRFPRSGFWHITARSSASPACRPNRRRSCIRTSSRNTTAVAFSCTRSCRIRVDWSAPKGNDRPPMACNLSADRG